MIIIILGTLTVDWLVGFLISYNKNKQLKRDEEIFQFKLEQILNNKNSTAKDRKADALELCRMTKGKLAAGAYFALFCDIELNKAQGNLKNNSNLHNITDQNKDLICDCGNKLTDKEIYFGQCLQCDKNIEED